MNEAVERAHREGVLSTASLMVAGAAAADAVARARRLPSLHVGLHLVVIEGASVLPPAAIPLLVGADGQFPSAQARLGVRYFFDLRARRQLRAEIAAQFAAFAATGLRLDHANAHKHMHLHPTVGRMMIEEGARHGLAAIRVPAEPTGGHGRARGAAGRRRPRAIPLDGRVAAAGPPRRAAHQRPLLRHRLERADDRGPGQPAAPTAAARAERNLLHPASGADALLQAVMPDYEHAAELATLLDPAVAAALPGRATWSDSCQ